MISSIKLNGITLKFVQNQHMSIFSSVAAIFIGDLAPYKSQMYPNIVVTRENSTLSSLDFFYTNLNQGVQVTGELVNMFDSIEIDIEADFNLFFSKLMRLNDDCLELFKLNWCLGQIKDGFYRTKSFQMPDFSSLKFLSTSLNRNYFSHYCHKPAAILCIRELDVVYISRFVMDMLSLIQHGAFMEYYFSLTPPALTPPASTPHLITPAQENLMPKEFMASGLMIECEDINVVLPESTISYECAIVHFDYFEIPYLIKEVQCQEFDLTWNNQVEKIRSTILDDISHPIPLIPFGSLADSSAREQLKTEKDLNLFKCSFFGDANERESGSFQIQSSSINEINYLINNVDNLESGRNPKYLDTFPNFMTWQKLHEYEIHTPNISLNAGKISQLSSASIHKTGLFESAFDSLNKGVDAPSLSDSNNSLTPQRTNSTFNDFLIVNESEKNRGFCVPIQAKYAGCSNLKINIAGISIKYLDISSNIFIDTEENVIFCIPILFI